jgi:Protein of unknown function (DUF3602)
LIIFILGNISKPHHGSQGAEDLKTPTIKGSKYTTGRGGTGNMAHNDPSHPEIARASQDVDGPMPREHEASFHIGRGGAANVVTPSEGKTNAAKSNNKRRSLEIEKTLEEETELMEK